jgi:hypothetical protein
MESYKLTYAWLRKIIDISKVKITISDSLHKMIFNKIKGPMSSFFCHILFVEG